MVKAGYKQTEVGLIPEDWEVKTLKDVVIDMLQGINTAIDIPEYVEDGIPMLKANNIIDGEVNFSSAAHISLKTFLGYSERYKLKKNDFLFSNIGARLGTGSLLKIDIEGSFAWNVMRIIPDTKKIIPEYFHFTINSPKFFQKITTSQIGSGMGFVPKNILLNISIPIPPTLKEQEIIAAALSNMDALIAGLDKLIAKKRAIKTGTMQVLLTGEKRLPGFGDGRSYKQTEIGLIPEDWSMVTLEELLDLLTDFEANGSFEKVAQNVKVYNAESYAWYVRATDLENNSSLNNLKFVDESSYKFLKKTSLRGGELLITKRGEIGKVYFFTPKTKYATLAPNLYLLKLNEKVIPQYLYYFFISDRGKNTLIEKNASTTLGALYKDDVKSMLVSLPTYEEQKAVSDLLLDMDAEITALETRRAKTQAIKQGMMQELLTGRTRLV